MERKLHDPNDKLRCPLHKEHDKFFGMIWHSNQELLPLDYIYCI